MPGPRVTEMKSGFLLRHARFAAAIASSPSRRSALGSSCMASLIRVARLSWCDSSDTMGWTPWYTELFEVIFLWKWRTALGNRERSLCSSMATEVSSHDVSMARVMSGRLLCTSMRDILAGRMESRPRVRERVRMRSEDGCIGVNWIRLLVGYWWDVGGMSIAKEAFPTGVVALQPGPFRVSRGLAYVPVTTSHGMPILRT